MIPLERDAVIGDRYHLVRSLGEGGMGWVWEATDDVTKKNRALKFLKRDSADDRRRFQREVRAAAAVRHPNVIVVHDLLELPDGTLVMVMDLLEGEALGALLRREKRIGLAEVAAILVPVTAALEATHAVGIIHRDLKPDNIFLSTVNGEVVVKVLDFGAAKLTETEGLASSNSNAPLTSTGAIVGTPYYMSPEQVFSEKDLDARADIWSLGVVMYECLCGSRPTEADTIGQVLKRIMKADFSPIEARCENLPADVASLVARMLSADREARPRDVHEVRDILARHAAARIASGRPITAEDAVDPRAATLPISVETSALSISVAGPRRGGRKGVLAIASMIVLAGVLSLFAFASGHTEANPIASSAARDLPSAAARPSTSGAEATAPVAANTSAPASVSASAFAPPAVSATPEKANVATHAPTSTSAVPRRPNGAALAPSASVPNAVWTER